MFPQLRALNGSHNAFSGPLPAGLGQTGVFRLSPLQFVNGEILMHVLDLSYNQLNGSLPSFLDASSVPAQYVQKGVFLQARCGPLVRRWARPSLVMRCRQSRKVDRSVCKQVSAVLGDVQICVRRRRPAIPVRVSAGCRPAAERDQSRRCKCVRGVACALA